MRVTAHDISLADETLEKRQLFGIGSSETGAPKQAIMLKRLVPAIDEKANRESEDVGTIQTHYR